MNSLPTFDLIWRYFWVRCGSPEFCWHEFKAWASNVSSSQSTHTLLYIRPSNRLWKINENIIILFIISTSLPYILRDLQQQVRVSQSFDQGMCGVLFKWATGCIIHKLRGPMYTLLSWFTMNQFLLQLQLHTQMVVMSQCVLTVLRRLLGAQSSGISYSGFHKRYPARALFKLGYVLVTLLQCSHK